MFTTSNYQPVLVHCWTYASYIARHWGRWSAHPTTANRFADIVAPLIPNGNPFLFILRRSIIQRQSSVVRWLNYLTRWLGGPTLVDQSQLNISLLFSLCFIYTVGQYGCHIWVVLTQKRSRFISWRLRTKKNKINYV